MTCFLIWQNQPNEREEHKNTFASMMADLENGVQVNTELEPVQNNQPVQIDQNKPPAAPPPDSSDEEEEQAVAQQVHKIRLQIDEDKPPAPPPLDSDSDDED